MCRKGRNGNILDGKFWVVGMLMCVGGRRCGQGLEDVEWMWKCVLSQCFGRQNVEFAAKEEFKIDVPSCVCINRH